MDDLYETIGTIAACAHANGDEIDENIRPQDNQNVTHGLDIYHRSHFMRIGTVENEARFEITCPYQFLNVLQNKIPDRELASRIDVDLDTLSPQERTQVLRPALTPELRKASAQYDEFVDAFSNKFEPVDADLIRITYGEEDLWNGFFVRDHIYPSEDGFSIQNYREAVSNVRAVRIQATRLAHDIVEVFDEAGSDELAETQPVTKDPRSSPGFQ